MFPACGTMYPDPTACNDYWHKNRQLSSQGRRMEAVIIMILGGNKRTTTLIAEQNKTSVGNITRQELE